MGCGMGFGINRIEIPGKTKGQEQLQPVGQGSSPALAEVLGQKPMKDLFMGGNVLPDFSDLRLVCALKRKHLCLDFYFYFSKGSCKCSHDYLHKCLILSLHPPNALGPGDIL